MTFYANSRPSDTNFLMLSEENPVMHRVIACSGIVLYCVVMCCVVMRCSVVQCSVMRWCCIMLCVHDNLTLFLRNADLK